MLLWKENGIYDVNYAVIYFQIGSNNCGIIHLHTSVRGINFQIRTFNSWRRIKVDNISRHHFTRDNVIGQNLCQLRYIV